jgi:hypothetical protein
MQAQTRLQGPYTHESIVCYLSLECSLLQWRSHVYALWSFPAFQVSVFFNFPEIPRNLSIFIACFLMASTKVCPWICQIGSIHVQRMWKIYRFGLTLDRIFWQKPAKVRRDEMVLLVLFPSQVDYDWFSGRYSRCCFSKGVSIGSGSLWIVFLLIFFLGWIVVRLSYMDLWVFFV